MKRVAFIALIVLLTVTGLLLLWQFRHVVTLFALSLAVSAAFRPPIDWLHERRVPLGLAMLLTYGLTVGVLAVIVLLMGSSLILEIQQAGNSLATGYQEIQTGWPDGSAAEKFIADQLPPLTQLSKAVAAGQGRELANALLGIGMSLAQIVSETALVLVLSIYWGIDRVHFERLWLSALPAEQRMRARRTWRSIEKGVGAYVRSEVVQSLLAGILLYVGFRAIGLPYPTLLALVGALAWLVPLVGGALALVPVALVGLLVGPWVAAGAAAYTIAVFLFLEMVLEPRIFHRRRYNSLLVVVAMIGLSSAMGILGLLLAPPLAAAIQIFGRELANQPLATTAEEALPAMAELKERVLALHRLAEQAEDGEQLEVQNMIQRLDHLVDSAGEALRRPASSRPHSPKGRARRAAGSCTGGSGRRFKAMIAWLRLQVFPLLRQAAAEWQTDQGPWLAAGTAYYAAFSIFPLLLFLMAVLGAALRLSPGARGAEQELLQLIAVNGSPGIAVQVHELLAEVKFQGGGFGPVALITLLFSAMGVFAALDVAFDRLWRVPPPADMGLLAVVRRILGQRMAAFVMLMGAGVLVVTVFVAGLALTALEPFVSHVPGASLGIPALRLGLGFATEVLVFAFLYKVLPKPQVPWGAAWRGALPTAVAWELGKQVLALFIIGANYNAYGVVGAFIAMMAWIYYGSNVFFFGAKLVQLISSRAEDAARKGGLQRSAPTTT